jgi:hypothetical protein
MVGVGAGYILGQAVSTRSGMTTTVENESTATATVTATTSIPGLELVSSISPPVISSGQNVTLDEGVYNPTATSVTINVTAGWNGAPCGDFYDPTSFKLYMGFDTFSNLSAAMPLLLFNASMLPPPCPVYSNSTFTFQPHSDNATWVSIRGTYPTTVNFTFVLGGFWLRASPADTFQEFTPGIYTVEFYDAWGQQALAYFEVE